MPIKTTSTANDASRHLPRARSWRAGAVGTAGVLLTVLILGGCGGHAKKADASLSGAASSAASSSAGGTTSAGGSGPATSAASATPSGSTTPSGSAPPTSGSTSASSAPHSGALSTVPTIPGTTLPPTPIKSTAAFGGGVTAVVTAIADETVTDTGPGIISGVPASAFTIKMMNGSKAAVSLDNVQVTASYGDNLPASQANLSKDRGFKGSLAAGASATGTYSFAIPTTDRNNVQLTIWYSPDQPTIVFSGAAKQ